MQPIDSLLQIEPVAAAAEIQAFLRSRMQALGKHGILLGLSGGLDSAVVAYLSARSVGAAKVRLLYLPDRDSKPVHARHAQLVARELGIPLEVRDITPVLARLGTYRLLPISRFPTRWARAAVTRWGRKVLGFSAGGAVLEARLRPEPNSYVSRGNTYGITKHRIRMVLLYQEADVASLMVAGAANRTELLTGTFSLWGCDHCADVMPVIHLYRSQLYPLAEYLGIPEAIRTIPADPDIVPGVDDKGELLGSFESADRILVGLENGYSREQLVESFGPEAVDRIVKLYDLSRPMREVPYTLESLLRGDN